MLHQLICIISAGLQMVDSVPFKLMYFSSWVRYFHRSLLVRYFHRSLSVRYFHRSLSVRVSCNTPEIQAANITSFTCNWRDLSTPCRPKDILLGDTAMSLFRAVPSNALIHENAVDLHSVGTVLNSCDDGRWDIYRSSKKHVPLSLQNLLAIGRHFVCFSI